MQQLYFNYKKRRSLLAKKKKSQTHRNKRVEWWLPGAEGWGKWGGVDQRVQTSVIRCISSGDLIYSMLTTGNNPVLQT